MSEAELCPTCKQPLPRDAMTTDPRGGAKPNCEYGPEPHRADFIIKGVAVCSRHASFVTQPAPES